MNKSAEERKQQVTSDVQSDTQNSKFISQQSVKDDPVMSGFINHNAADIQQFRKISMLSKNTIGTTYSIAQESGIQGVPQSHSKKKAESFYSGE